MYYIMYLTGLCQRRRWPDPLYEARWTRHGWTCTVRVNNREYTADGHYEGEDLARDAAASRAYMICRNFSVNDGMYPGQRQGQGGIIQGLPVAIGTGRRQTIQSRSSDRDYDHYGGYSDSASGGSSPRSSDSGLDSGSRRSSKSSRAPTCYCGRGSIRAHDRCSSCLREYGYY